MQLINYLPVPVYFETETGEANPSKVQTTEGIAETSWTLGSQNTDQKLSAYFKDGTSRKGEIEINAKTDENPSSPDDYIAYYPFNGSAADVSGNGHLGELSGPTLTSDRFDNVNSAYHFDGIDDYINIGNTIKPDFPLTICLWIKPDNITAADLFRTDVVGGDSNYYYGAIVRLREGRVVARFGNGPANPSARKGLVTNESIISTDQWYFVSCVFNNSDDLKIYVDGESYPGTYEGTASSMAHSNADGAIGNQYENRNNYGGAIDDIMVFDRSLSETEISELYQMQGE